MQERLKSVAKGAMAVLSVALVVTVLTHVVDQMYDLRLILAAAGGAFGYQPLVNLFNKIKQLQ